MLYLFIGLCIGALLGYLCLRPKINEHIQLNERVQQQNEQLQEEQNELLERITELKQCRQDLENYYSDLYNDTDKLRLQQDNLLSNISNLQNQSGNLITQIDSLQKQSENITNNISNLQEQSKQISEEVYQSGISLASAQMELATQQMSEKYQDAEEEASQEYLDTLNSLQETFQKEISKSKEELERVNAELADLTAKLNATIELRKRQEELETKQDFYRIQLSHLDLEEIQRLRSVAPYLRDSEPLNKVIWKVYYEKPFNDLVGRVIGPGVHTGIYKITHIDSQKCYVGQAANLSDRWRQHTKRGLGAESPTRNKLYPAMLEYGVENFTFEVLEECPRAQLDSREDYWQEVLQAREYGLSIK